MQARQLFQLLDEICGVAAFVRHLVHGRTHGQVLEDCVAEHVDDPFTVLLVSHVEAREHAEILALLVFTSVAKGDTERIKALAKIPRIARNDERDFLLGLHLDIQARDPFANAPVGRQRGGKKTLHVID